MRRSESQISELSSDRRTRRSNRAPTNTTTPTPPLQRRAAGTLSPEEVDPALDQEADKFVGMLISEEYNTEDKRAAIDGVGLRTQQEAARRSKMLEQPIKNLAQAGEDGGPVAQSLVGLQEQIEELDPVNFDFTTGGVMRLLGKIPGVGKPMKRYFTKYQSAQTVVDAIIKSLEQGREQLKRDNTTLSFDQQQMRNATERLARAIQLGQVLDQKLQYKLDREISPEDDQYGFVQEELMFPLPSEPEDKVLPLLDRYGELARKLR